MNKIPLTINQRARVAQAIEETKKLIAKEMTYSADLRNTVWLAEYEAHLLKLEDALKLNAM